MIRPCTQSDFEATWQIINDAARAYKGVIPDDRWHEPYMSRDELQREIDDGVQFWGFDSDDGMVGVMGVQDKGEVNLIRHAYIKTAHRRKGIGAELLRFLESRTDKPILIGTWADARWAVSFYQKHGYRSLGAKEKDALLRKFWSIPERQIETSVVLANAKWKGI
jgi:GNAT superfamily N-acetyltransferase